MEQLSRPQLALLSKEEQSIFHVCSLILPESWSEIALLQVSQCQVNRGENHSWPHQPFSVSLGRVCARKI